MRYKMNIKEAQRQADYYSKITKNVNVVIV